MLRPGRTTEKNGDASIPLLSEEDLNSSKLLVAGRIAAALRLVFTSDGVVIRSVERYDLVKIKPTESEAEHRF